MNFGELASRIKAGMSQDEVLQVAGEPTNKLEFAWVYKNPDSVGEVLVVVFRDGKVEGVRHYTPPVDETLPAGEADPSGFGGAAGG